MLTSKQMPKSLKIYLAAPLFTLAERSLNAELARELTKAIPRAEIILPQIRAAAFVIHGKMDFENVVRDCIKGIESADALVAILDGADSDSGTSWECGYAYARRKPIVGVRTDLRSSEDGGLNAMLQRTCAQVIVSPATSATVKSLAREIAATLLLILHTKSR
jgi:nucleoside 2-deoxyribosyltransferase